MQNMLFYGYVKTDDPPFSIYAVVRVNFYFRENFGFFLWRKYK